MRKPIWARDFFIIKAPVNFVSPPRSNIVPFAQNFNRFPYGFADQSAKPLASYRRQIGQYTFQLKHHRKNKSPEKSQSDHGTAHDSFAPSAICIAPPNLALARDWRVAEDVVQHRRH